VCGGGGHAAETGFALSMGAATALRLRRLGPFSSTRWARWMTRSRMASPKVRQGIEPSCVVGLKAEQLGDGIHPALKPGPLVGGTPISDLRLLLLHFETCAVTGLPLGVATWRLTWGLAVWHGFDRRYVTLCRGI
jgi:hypothetical protein